MLDRNKGFAPIILVFIAVGAIALVCGGAVLYQNTKGNRSGGTINHNGLEELKELTQTVQSNAPPAQTPVSNQERAQYEQKKEEIRSDMQHLEAEDPSDITWDDMGMFLEQAELLQRLGDTSGMADKILAKLKERAEELMKQAMAKDICNVTLEDIKQMLLHARQAMLLGSEVEGLMDWLGDALEQLAAERVDSWPEKWPPEFNIDFIADWNIAPEKVVEKISGIDCSSGSACERLDFMELAAMFGQEELMDDILTGSFERIKSRQKENCKKGCCHVNGEVNEGVLKNICERTAGAMWKEGKCQTGYRVHLIGKSSGEGKLGPMFGSGTGAFQKMLGADMSVDISGVADLTTCDKSVYSKWKGIMIMKVTTSNKKLGTETKTHEDEITIPFDENGVFEGKIDVFLSSLGFSAKVNEESMNFTYNFGGTMPTITMQGKVEKGKVVCDAVDK